MDAATGPNVTYGNPITLQAVQAGSQEVAPGPWASHVKKLNFTVAKQGEALKTATLVTLDQKPANRELVLRDTRHFQPEILQQKLAEKVSKVEAALCYIVGDIADPPCQGCERGLGPFPHCVRVEGCGFLTACANCRWNDDDERCTFTKSLDDAHTEKKVVLTPKALQATIKCIVAQKQKNVATRRSVQHSTTHLTNLGHHFMTGNQQGFIAESREAVHDLNSIYSTTEESDVHFEACLPFLMKALHTMEQLEAKEAEQKNRRKGHVKGGKSW